MLALVVLLACLMCAVDTSASATGTSTVSNLACSQRGGHHHRLPAADLVDHTATESPDSEDPVARHAERTTPRPAPVALVVFAGQPPSSTRQRVLSMILRI